MHKFIASILAIFATYNAWGDARLPVVNVGSAGVSARAAFGEEIVLPSETIAPIKQNADVIATPKTRTRAVVARAGAKPVVKKSVTGEKVAAVADVLVPRRPSSDLWATNDAPLRMPNPNEFSVVNYDYDLPEESIDYVAPKRDLVARNAEPVTKHEAMTAIDNQIARLVELQRRAEESVSDRPSQIVATPVAERVEPIVAQAEIPKTEDTTMKLSRLVVPMESDVVVRTVEKNTSPRITSVRNDMTSMSPSELRRAFRKTFLSENKHLSTFQMDDRFDVASDMSTGIEGFTAARDLSEAGGIRPLEIKIKFRNDDSALSRDNYTLLTEYASIVVSNPKRAIQVAIPADATTNSDARKLAARRLAIIEQVLRDTGVAEQRILPVMSSRSDDGFLLRIISNEQYETLTQQQRNTFGNGVSSKTYKSISW